MKKSDVRDQIVQYLLAHGPVEDPNGRATTQLRDDLSFRGSNAAFTQLVAALAKSGEIERTIRGKRTYRIALAGPSRNAIRRDAKPRLSKSDNAGTGFFDQIDYDEFASALLARVVAIIAADDHREDRSIQTSTDNSDGWTGRRAQKLERKAAELEREMARVRAELRRITEERDSYRRRFELSEGNLALLADKLSNIPAKGSMEGRLGAEEKLLLQQLLTSVRPERSDRAV
jgi:hypothetical protein